MVAPTMAYGIRAGRRGRRPLHFLFLHSEEKTGHITPGRKATGQLTPRRRTRRASGQFVKCITGKMRTTRAKGEGTKRNFGFFPYIFSRFPPLRFRINAAKLASAYCRGVVGAAPYILGPKKAPDGCPGLWFSCSAAAACCTAGYRGDGSGPSGAAVPDGCPAPGSCPWTAG